MSLRSLLIALVALTPLFAQSVRTIIEEARDGKTDQVRALLDSGIEIETTDNRGTTPLIAAATHGMLDTVKLLVERGANVNAYADYYGTAVFSAYGHVHMETVAYLIEKGADLNIAKEEGRTLLMSAALFGDAERIKLFLAAGADKALKTDEGKTALMIATAAYKERAISLRGNKVMQDRFKETIRLLGGKISPAYKVVGRVFKSDGKIVEIIGEDAIKIKVGAGLIIRTSKGDVPAVVKENYHTKSKCIAPNWYTRIRSGDLVLAR
jgi:hypothetical protein